MAGPGLLLLLLGGGLLPCARGGVPMEVGVLQEAEPQEPKCFTRRLHDLTCFWEQEPPPRGPPRLLYRYEQEEWRSCPLRGEELPGGRWRFWCSLPPPAITLFLPLELKVLPPPTAPSPTAPPATGPPPTGPPATTDEPPPLFQRILYIEQVVLLDPPENVSVSAGGARGEVCVRWQPPPNPYLESSLAYELALRAPGLPPRTVGVPAGRREQRVGSLRGSSRYSVRARTRPDGLSFRGFWSPWSPPATIDTPPDVDAVTLGLSCLLALLLLALGLLALMGHRRVLREKLWPPVPGPEREFEGLFSAYGGNFQLWLCQGVGAPWLSPGGFPEPEELPSPVEEVGPPPGKGPPHEETPPAASVAPPPGPPPSAPSPASSFEYTLFDPGSALLCPRAPPPAPPPPPGDPPPGAPSLDGGSSYANLAPPRKGPPPPPPEAQPPQWGPPPADGGDPPAPTPPYVVCS